MTELLSVPVDVGVPDDAIPLPEGHLACTGCGVAVPVGGPVTVVEVTEREGQLFRTEPRPGPAPAGLRVEMLTCGSCRGAKDAAVATLGAFPALAGRIGESHAAHRLSCALDGMAVLGLKPPGTMTEREILAVLRHLSGPGAVARWITRYVPVAERDATPDQCAPYPWARVGIKARSHLRTAYAQALRDRVDVDAPPQSLTPPYGPPGCILCGVGAQSVPALTVNRAGGRYAASRMVWERVRVDVHSLGGRRNPNLLEGSLCRVCAEATEWSQSVGYPAMARSLDKALKASGRGDVARRLATSMGDLTGLVGWGAAWVDARRAGETPPRPNGRAWDHLKLPD